MIDSVIVADPIWLYQKKNRLLSLLLPRVSHRPDWQGYNETTGAMHGENKMPYPVNYKYFYRKMSDSRSNVKKNAMHALFPGHDVKHSG